MSNDQLQPLRAQIDQVDQKLVEFFAERQRLVSEVGKIKKAQNIQVLQPKRWGEVLEKNVLLGAQFGLARQFVVDIWERIHQEALSIEEKQKL